MISLTHNFAQKIKNVSPLLSTNSVKKTRVDKSFAFFALEKCFTNRAFFKNKSDTKESVKLMESFANDYLNIKADYGNNYDIASMFTEGFIDLKKKNYKLPVKEIIYGAGSHPEIAVRQQDPSVMLTSWGKKIYINPNHNFSYIEEEMAMSNRNPKHCVYHEIGEMLFRKKPSTFFKSLKWPLDLSMPANEQIQIAQNVSHYGSTAINEFVAEVFAGHVSGKNFSNNIMNLYHKYNGVNLH